MGRSSDGSLTTVEIALMKAMLRRGTFPNEQIAAYFNHPSRTFNQGRVTDAKQGKRWAHIEPTTDTELDDFLTWWHAQTPSPATAFSALGPLHPSKLRLLFPLDRAKPDRLSSVSDSDLSSGAIYFRYPGETCVARALEIQAMLRERDRRIEERMASVVQRLQQVGTGQAAIIDLETGRVDGQMGHFLLPAELLPQVRVVQEGRLVDTEGSPALRLVGDLQVVGTGGPVVSVRKENLQDEDVIEDFLRQRPVQNPEDYLRYLGHSRALWLPAYYYARAAKLDDNTAANLVAAGSKGKKKRPGEQASRIRLHELPGMIAQLNRGAFAALRASVGAGEAIPLDNEIAVSDFLKAAATVDLGEVALPQLLEPLLRIFDERYYTLSGYAMQLFRNAVVRADLLFFAEKD